MLAIGRLLAPKYIFICTQRLLYRMSHSHSICVFDSNRASGYWHAPIYRKISQHVSDGYAVVYILEQDTRATVRRMSKMGFDVGDHIQSGALTLIDNDIFYSPLIPSATIIEQWYKLFSNIEKRNSFKGFVAMGMPSESFFTSPVHQERLVEYESTVAKSYDGGVEAICCYTTQLVNRMPLKQLIRLLNAHQNTSHADSLRKWDDSMALLIARTGLSEALGTRAAELLLDILAHDHPENENDIVYQPTRFEEKLVKVMGMTATQIIFEKIRSQFTKETVYQV